MRGSRSYLPVDDILPSSAKDMIDDIGEESDDDSGTLRRTPSIFPMTKTSFQRFEPKLQKMIIGPQ
jgi:hypothetical protein